MTEEIVTFEKVSGCSSVFLYIKEGTVDHNRQEASIIDKIFLQLPLVDKE